MNKTNNFNLTQREEEVLLELLLRKSTMRIIARDQRQLLLLTEQASRRQFTELSLRLEEMIHVLAEAARSTRTAAADKNVIGIILSRASADAWLNWNLEIIRDKWWKGDRLCWNLTISEVNISPL